MEKNTSWLNHTRSNSPNGWKRRNNDWRWNCMGMGIRKKIRTRRRSPRLYGCKSFERDASMENQRNGKNKGCSDRQNKLQDGSFKSAHGQLWLRHINSGLRALNIASLFFFSFPNSSTTRSNLLCTAPFMAKTAHFLACTCKTTKNPSSMNSVANPVNVLI